MDANSYRGQTCETTRYKDLKGRNLNVPNF